MVRKLVIGGTSFDLDRMSFDLCYWTADNDCASALLQALPLHVPLVHDQVMPLGASDPTRTRGCDEIIGPRQGVCIDEPHVLLRLGVVRRCDATQRNLAIPDSHEEHAVQCERSQESHDDVDVLALR